ncbi:beta-ketoacyl synthase N-terminal-like domain-containing protein [Streptomyces sp. SS7]|uniref:type I polyketide synthase n=1 Tax=Streptomyces sp. SS7 TaxID=3108485 RepID=UPI0030EDD254
MSNTDDLGDDSAAVAVISMAGRYPGTADTEEFWQHLVAGKDLITRFPEAGDGRAVPAYGIVPDADCFDAQFFGYSPAEALLLDPQQRLFLECCAEALERAGCVPAGQPGPIGVYAGSGASSYAEQLRADPSVAGVVPDWHLQLATGVDFLTTRAAYKLGLTGPAVTVQTACSTSLVAVHLAVQALVAGECFLALAGGVSLRTPHPVVIPPEGGIFAPDGYCRPFDARAQGTVAADGAGVVLLKRLSDALADGDHVHAVIRGSAVNNDGVDKVGFTAPSVTGQTTAIRTAYAVAGIDVDTVGYIETHGTGTPMGDPIEISALTGAFRAGTDRVGFCRIGSVKSNIGHTDTASGVIGLIKTVLAVEHGVIPATLHFTEPNKELGLGSGPFVVNDETTEWPRTDTPRRAGVNSLGIGGTNAHVVVEQAPPPAAAAEREDAAGPQLLVLSAPSPQGLAASAEVLADRLAEHPGTPLADVAWTLQTGRTAHDHRLHVVGEDHADAARLLRGATGRGPRRTDPAEVTFLFPGQGGQHPGMGRELYAWSPAFRERVDTCVAVLGGRLGEDVRTALLVGADDPERFAAVRERLDAMELAQPVLFTLEYALAGLWQSLGISPTRVLGHSLGAYAAACTAGVLTPEDALTLVVERGRLLGSLPTGAMLAVALSPAELGPLLTDELSIAAVNGASQCVVSGPAEATERFRRDLEGREVDTRRLHISSAAHSHLVEAVLDEFDATVRAVRPHSPVVPWISDSHGRAVTADEVRDRGYWTGHLRHTVRFDEALSTALREPGVLLEVGPGHTLATLTRRHRSMTDHHRVLSSLPHAVEETSAHAAVLDTAGELWRHGLPLSWARMHTSERRRVPLPTYPFQRRRYAPAGPAPRTTAAAPRTAGPLPEPPAQDAPATAAPPTPGHTGDTAARLARVFCDVLGLDAIGPDDNFFEAGGDSLIATRLASLIHREFGVKVTVRTILLAPSVARLLPRLLPEERPEK